MNSDAVYVKKQPKTGIATIVIMDNEDFPLETASHDNLDKLCTFSDVMLVFPKDNKRILIPKFANLYGICSYRIGSSGKVSIELTEMLRYCVNVFEGQHSTFLITDESRLSTLPLTEDTIQKITNIIVSGAALPILEIERLGSEELYSIYKNEGETEENNKSLWSTIFNPGKEYDATSSKLRDRMWSTHRTKTGIVFMRKPVVDHLILDPDYSYMDTFSESDFGYYLASLIKEKGIDNIQSDIYNVKINGGVLEQ